MWSSELWVEVIISLTGREGSVSASKIGQALRFMSGVLSACTVNVTRVFLAVTTWRLCQLGTPNAKPKPQPQARQA